MSKRFIYLYLLIPAILLTLSCQLISGFGNTLQGSGDLVTEARPAEGFDRVSVCCGMHLLLTQGGSESLKIRADSNLLPEIESAVTDGTLVVRYKDHFGGARYEPTSPVQVQVAAIQLREIVLSGGGWMQSEPLAVEDLSLDLSGASQARLGAIDTGQLDLSMSGGGNLFIQESRTSRIRADLSGGARLEMDSLSGEEFSLASSGGGWIRLKGRVMDQQATLSGGTRYEAGDLESGAATIEMNGGGNGTVWATQTLTVDLSGGANLAYYGRPAVNSNLSGGSRLQPLGEK